MEVSSKTRYKIFAVITAFIMGIVIFTVPTENVEAKSSVSVQKTASIAEGSSKTIKLKNVNPKAKVKWSVSDMTVLKITAYKGKKRTSARVKALKEGKCKLSAKVLVKKKKNKRTYKVYTCKVTVTENNTPDPDDLAKDYPYDKTLGNEATDDFVQATANFSLGLLRESVADDQTNGKDRNILVSPDSVATALVMAENGADGATKEEIAQVLGGNLSVEDYNGYIAGLNNRLKSAESVKYRVANSIWADSENGHVLPAFIKTNKAYHNASMYSVKFNDDVADRVNAWVAKNTKNMIKQIMAKPVPGDMKMVLVNTVAFEGEWEAYFDGPADRPFTDKNGSESNVKTLRERGGQDYISMENAEGFAKYYQGGEIAFVGLLPDEGISPEELVQNMNGEEFIQAWQNRERKALDITLPQFSYDYDITMNEPLKKLGMPTAFDEDNAEFHSIFDDEEEYYISKVMHKTHIELDRYGTKAAAATSVEMSKATAIKDYKNVHLDRPFVYALVDTQTGLPLFVGILSHAVHD